MLSRNKPLGSDHASEPTDLKPFINFLVVLIPVLMISAEYAKISTISLNLGTRGVQTDSASSNQPIAEQERISLTVLVSDSTLTIGTASGFLPSIGYAEFHRYIKKNDRSIEKTVPYFPAQKLQDQQQVAGFDKQDILLYAKDPESGLAISAAYSTRYGVLLVDGKGEPVLNAHVGDTLHYINEPDGMIVMRSKDDFVMRPLSAYDDLETRLARIRQRFPNQPGMDSIIIASDVSVIYDKLIQVMDVVRDAGFSTISIAKLRA